jgi:MYXO-CTERM domain-containing protein
MCPPESCETVETKYCVNAPCDADSDCPGNMRCYAPTLTECTGGGMTGCDPGAGGCGEPVPVDAGTQCHEEIGDATCTLRYHVPCSAAADCGPGFACEEEVYTVCSGGGMGGSPAAHDGGAVADPGECHTESSGNFVCRLLNLPCDSNGDCEAGLECQSNPSHNLCAPHDYYGGMNPPPVGTDGGISNGGGEGSDKDAAVPGDGMGGASGGIGSDAGSGQAGAGGSHAHHRRYLPHLGCSVAGDSSSQLATWFGLIGVITFGLRRRVRGGKRAVES